MDNRLPHNPREGIVYGCVIASISSLLIGGYNVFDNMGYTFNNFDEFLMQYIVIWPVMFVIAFTLANTLVGHIAGKVVNRLSAPGDSVNSRIILNIVVCVTLMSVILTFVGGLVGEAIGSLMGGPSVDVIGLLKNWPLIWPRNFCIAFWVEMLIAQPAARAVMVWAHTPKKKSGSEA